ncbi:PQQ-binding-like beta-propeller repeat protein [Pelagicoccus sp. SDUM812005]|uniref:outer membrane protein assembly factor BamB family protein n=1 Tax=Pelagicoccus sp. SDUM812005 TaxID=3041257 RepID=UPI00280D96AA|nr:PQQ-binding-like beta-propeller repeat protein [Pelagicoccus sp. SDUM812005]MDQ8179552.1 PQQ-binding-like beta-propeller repeat protein [Pelagicoccus sp. SDUM812005]
MAALCAQGILASAALAGENWPQAAGPNFGWKVAGTAATEWSVVEDRNIKWRSTLPEGGQSSVTVWGDRLFLTSYKPLESAAEAASSTDLLAYCLDAKDGSVLWTAELPGSVAVGVAGIFSDASVFAPVTDGRYVWFFNRSGSMACYDWEGKRVWNREYVPRNRHTNRQAEPILLNGQLLVVEVRDKEAARKLQRHQPVPEDVNARSVWTYVHGYDAYSGELLWTESTGTVVHNCPSVGRLANGEWAVLHARGGPHHALETPYGLSLSSLSRGREGEPLWSTEIQDVNPMMVNVWDEQGVYAFAGEDHVILDTETGRLRSQRSLRREVDRWRYDAEAGDWVFQAGVDLEGKKPRLNTYATNIVVGDWHYFLAHETNAIGRVDLRNERVEYLDLPYQLSVEADGSRQLIWDLRQAIPSVPRNSRGIELLSDQRSRGTGWGHVSAASPILVGRYLYFPMMSGTVYVIDTQAPNFNANAIVAINDLGPAGETWSLSSLSYASGRLYARTLKEVVCIE